MNFEVPGNLIDGVIRVFEPVEIYLFGSHARGDAHEDSDIDLFVVIDDIKKGTLEPGESIAAARNGFRGALDLIVTTRSSFQSRKSVVGTLDEIVSGEGALLYARG